MDKVKIIRNAVAFLFLKALVVVALVISLWRGIGARSINAHDDLLLVLGVFCLIGAPLIALFGAVWIADGIVKTIKRLEAKS